MEKASEGIFNSKGPAYNLVEAIEFQLEKLIHDKHVQTKRSYIGQSSQP
jgi:hypothetical protein